MLVDHPSALQMFFLPLSHLSSSRDGFCFICLFHLFIYFLFIYLFIHPSIHPLIYFLAGSHYAALANLEVDVDPPGLIVRDLLTSASYPICWDAEIKGVCHQGWPGLSSFWELHLSKIWSSVKPFIDRIGRQNNIQQSWNLLKLESKEPPRAEWGALVKCPAVIWEFHCSAGFSGPLSSFVPAPFIDNWDYSAVLVEPGVGLQQDKIKPEAVRVAQEGRGPAVSTGSEVSGEKSCGRERGLKRQSRRWCQSSPFSAVDSGAGKTRSSVVLSLAIKEFKNGLKWKRRDSFVRV